MTWLDAFLWTLALETPIYALFLRGRLGVVAFLATALGINAFTHPIVWNTMLRFADYETGWWVMESFAVASEAAIVGIVLARMNRRRTTEERHSVGGIVARAFLAALAANAFSAIAGPRIVDFVAAL